MKALLIEPRAKAISLVELPDDTDGQMKAMYEHLKCDLFSTVAVQRTEEGGDTMFVDDMGMYRSPLWCDDIFKFTGYPIPLIGNALVLGNDAAGETVPVSMTPEDMAKWITFTPHFCPESEFDCEYYGESEAEG